jgi:aminoglycoside 2''-phosphotransferase
MDQNHPLLLRVQTIMPDLVIDEVEHNQEGLINDILIINHQWVFRFAKNERYARIMDDEIRILEMIRPHTSVNLPRARFYAQSIELQWVLQGLESGETFWYTAHMGGARDLE